MSKDTPTAAQRRWKEAQHAAEHAIVVPWPQALREARALDDDQMAAAAQGCTGPGCIQHGAVNHVRTERARQAS